MRIMFTTLVMLVRYLVKNFAVIRAQVKSWSKFVEPLAFHGRQKVGRILKAHYAIKHTNIHECLNANITMYPIFNGFYPMKMFSTFVHKGSEV